MRIAPSHAAIRVVQEEHDKFYSVLSAMGHFVKEMREGAGAPDLKVFRAMLVYVSEYLEKLHHPNEEDYLFAALRRRTDSANAALFELQCQHAQGDALVRKLEHLLNRYELLGEIALPAFCELADRYIRFYLDHMRLEEEAILPAAVRYLTPEDWKTVDSAFQLHSEREEVSGYKEVFDKLFTTIVNITPAPLGLGPER